MTRLSLSKLTVGRMPSLDLALESEICTLVVAPADGAGALIPILGGLVKPKLGTVHIDGEDPWKRVELRRRVATLLESEPFVDRTATTQRFPDPINRQFARRSALAFALGVEAPLVVALVEPFDACTDRRALVTTLAERVAKGTVVFCITRSVGDAVALGGRVLRVDRVSDAVHATWRDWSPSELSVRTEDASLLAAALATEADASVHTEIRSAGELAVHAEDLELASLLVMKAAVSGGVRIIALSGRDRRDAALDLPASPASAKKAPA